MRALLPPGSKVVAITPAYQSLYELADSNGCAVEFWEPHMHEDGGLEYRVQDVLVRKPLCMQLGAHGRLAAFAYRRHPGKAQKIVLQWWHLAGHFHLQA